jgi:hypothetical protein
MAGEAAAHLFRVVEIEVLTHVRSLVAGPVCARAASMMSQNASISMAGILPPRYDITTTSAHGGVGPPGYVHAAKHSPSGTLETGELPALARYLRADADT